MIGKIKILPLTGYYRGS